MTYEWDPFNCLSELYPPFALQVESSFENMWKDSDLRPYIFCGYRSFEFQSDLYQRGRRGIDGEKIVTKAKPGYSIHQYGLAIDVVKDGNEKKPNLQAVWADVEWYRKISEKMVVGIDWSGNWKTFREYCHFQNTFGLSLVHLQSEMKLSNRNEFVLTYEKGMKEFYGTLDNEIALAGNR